MADLSPDTAATGDDQVVRHVPVAPERLAGWLTRFAERHGELQWAQHQGRARLRAADGATATFDLPGRPLRVPADGEELVAAASGYATFALLLLRRGGWAVGRVEEGRLAGSRCGTRYVQGRTAAGGWSQQRFARRRSGQADALVDDVARALRDVVAASTGDLVAGGDRALVRQALEQCRVPGLAERLRDDWLEVREPRRRVLEEAVGAARAVRVGLDSRA